MGELNHEEIKVLIPRLVADVSSTSSIPALLCLLSIHTQFSFTGLSEISLVPRFDPAKQVTQIIPDAGCWGRNYPNFSERVIPTEQQAKLLLPHQEYLLLPLADKVLAAIRSKYRPTSSISLLKLLEFQTKAEMESVVRAYLSELRSAYPTLRATPGRIRNMLFTQLVQSDGDDLRASFACNTAEFAFGLGFNYYAAPVRDLQERYIGGLQKIGLNVSATPADSDRHLGSYLAVPLPPLRQKTANLHAKFATCSSELHTYEEVRLFHHQMCAYTLQMLQFGTGHRAIKEWFFHSSTLDQGGWACLRDKVMDEGHQSRLVRLSPILQKQIDLFMQHRQGLALRLKKIAPHLAEHIGALHRLPQSHAEPGLFLFLGETPEDPPRPFRRADMEAVMEVDTTLPPNLARHMLMSRLKAASLPAELVSGVMGHIQLGQQPYGAIAINRPHDMTAEWDVAVDEWLAELGFANLPGLEATKRTTPATASPNFCALHLETEAQVSRKDSLKKIKQWIKECAPVSSDSSKRIFTDLAWQQRVYARIETEFENRPSQSIRYRNLLSRYVRIYRDKNQGSKTLGFIVGEQVEPSPLRPDHPLWVDRGEWLRNHLAEILPGAIQGISSEDRQLWSILCLMAFDGQLDRRQWSEILAALPHGLIRFNNRSWLEWTDRKNTNRIHRCWPSPVTSMWLLAACQDAYSPIVPRSFDRKIEAFLEQKFQLRKHWPELWGHQKGTPCLDAALMSVEAWMRMHLPGVLVAYARGDHESWELPRSTILRLLSGARLQACTPELSVAERQPPKSYARLNKVSATRSVEYTKSLLALLSQGIAGSQVAHHEKHDQKSHRVVLKNVQTLREEWAANENDQALSPVLSALTDYAEHLLTTNSIKQKLFAATTIRDYIGSIATRLVEEVGDRNWFELSGDQLEEIYRAVLGYQDQGKTRARRALLLSFFHDFCCDSYAFDEINWYEIAPELGASRTDVCANIVSHDEYQRAISLLHEDPFVPPRQRRLQSLLLMLCARFGLRVGEALRLTLADIVLSEGVILYIRSNRFGAPKTENGFRQLPCWTMAADERELLETQIENLKFVHPDTPSAALFSIPDQPHRLESRQILTARVRQVLKLVTGDDTIRIHHLRHTFSTAAVLLALEPAKNQTPPLSDWFDGDATALYENWLGPTYPSRRLIWAISLHMGHSHPQTTLVHYTHMLDVALARNLSEHTVLPGYAQLSQWCGTAEASLRKRKERKGPEFLSELLQDQFKQCRWPEDSTSLIATPLTPEELPVFTSSSVQVTDRQLAMVIHGHINNCAPELLAKYIWLPATDLNELLRKADALIHKLRYVGFDEVTSKYCDTPSFERISSALFDLEKQDALCAAKGIKIWRARYIANKPGVSFPVDETDEIHEFEQFLTALKIGKIWYPTKFDEQEFPPHEQPMSVLKRGARYPSKLRNERGTYDSMTIVVQVHGEELTAHSQLGMRKFHHVMFLHALRLDAKKVLGEQIAPAMGDKAP